MEQQRLTFDTQHAHVSWCEATEKVEKASTAAEVASIGGNFVSPVIHCQPFLLLSSVHTSHNLILMGELSLQFCDQNDVYEDQDLVKSHYLVTSSTSKCLGRTESALKLRVMVTFQHCNEGFYSEGYFLF